MLRVSVLYGITFGTVLDAQQKLDCGCSFSNKLTSNSSAIFLEKTRKILVSLAEFKSKVYVAA